MRINITRRQWFYLLILALGGAIGGFINGLLGAGGGIVITLTLSFLLPEDDENRRATFANSLCVMLPLSMLTLFRYAASEKADVSSISEQLGASFSAEALLIAAAVGGAIGGLLLGRIGSALLSRIFAVLCVISGVLMII